MNRNKLKKVLVSVLGYRRFLRMTAQVRTIQGHIRRDEFDAMAELVPSGSTILDVGANIGYVSRKFARRRGCRVVAVEPDADNFHCLSWLVRGIRNVRVLRCAVGAQDGCVRLEVPVVEGVPQHALARVSDVGDEIAIRTVDSIRAAYGRIAALKIDVEGYEANLLHGMHITLGEDRPIIYVEICGADSIQAYKSMAERYGYRPSQWRDGRWVDAKIDASGNYLLRPRGAK